MHAGLILLCLAYVLSQFFALFWVLSEVLERDIGAGSEALAQASGLWFLSFAAMQLPAGWPLDRIGPRLSWFCACRRARCLQFFCAEQSDSLE